MHSHAEARGDAPTNVSAHSQAALVRQANGASAMSPRELLLLRCRRTSQFPLQLASSAGAEADLREQEVAGLNFYKLAYVPGILPARDSQR